MNYHTCDGSFKQRSVENLYVQVFTYLDYTEYILASILLQSGGLNMKSYETHQALYTPHEMTRSRYYPFTLATEVRFLLVYLKLILNRLKRVKALRPAGLQEHRKRKSASPRVPDPAWALLFLGTSPIRIPMFTTRNIASHLPAVFLGLTRGFPLSVSAFCIRHSTHQIIITSTTVTRTDLS